MFRLRQCLAPTSDRSAFYLVFDENTFVDCPRIYVYRVNIFEDQSTIHPVSTLKVDDDPLSLTVSGTRVLCYTEQHRIIVWDIESNQSISWASTITPETDVSYPLTIHTYGNNILIAHEGQLYQWKTPPLRPLTGSGLPQIDQNAPISVIGNLFHYGERWIDPGDEPDPLLRDLFAPPQSPWRGNSNSGYMLMLSFPGAALHHLQLNPSSPDPLVVPSHVTTFNEFDILDDSISGEVLVCDGNLIFSCHANEQEDVCVQIITSPEENDIKAKTCVELLGLNSFGCVLSARLCPATGRLCVLNQCNEIVIADYLKRPSQ
ncbi:hypothetical protein NLJ89_g10173 [Agrocybe chaxingu]|uniref:Uncharacterized protein n=1 Tax=Agrocybe chaxingu TaxID=84603 RepID=A0A9W8JS75_9AGAR|nr:hypothetical protein NLJ89_g10173 [Agrocybe chaxingu]